MVENYDANYTEDWIIDNDHIYIIQTNKDNGHSDTTDQGTYIVKAGLTKKIIRTNGFRFAWFNNLDWKIEKLKGGQLIMFSDRDNYFLYYEFVKK